MGQWPFGPLAHAGTLAFGQCTWRRLGKCKRVSDGAKRLSELFYISRYAVSKSSQNVGARGEIAARKLADRHEIAT